MLSSSFVRVKVGIAESVVFSIMNEPSPFSLALICEVVVVAAAAELVLLRVATSFLS